MTLPTFVAAGAIASSAVADITPALPAGWAQDDIFFLFCETNQSGGPTAPSGWTTVPGSPQVTTTGNGCTISAFWRRATNSESAPTVGLAGLNHISGHIEAYRGCATSDPPFVFSTGIYKHTASTTFTFPAFSTPIADSLIIFAGANGTDTTTNQASAQTNSDLTSIAERFDGFASDGDGGGVSVMTGAKTAAGAFGATTWTWASSAADVGIMIILRPSGTTQPMPWFVAAGTSAASATVDITPGLPTGWAQDDIFVLVVESGNASTPGTPATPSGWTHVTNSPQSTTTGTGSALSVFYRRATGSESAPTVALGSLDHLSGQILAIRGCHNSDTPWDVTVGGHNDTSDASFSATGGTTTVANTLIAVIGGNGTDSATAQFGDWANTDIIPSEILENRTALGGGGGVAVALGAKMTAGAFGATTATLATSNADTFLTIAFRVPSAAVSSSAVFTDNYIIIG